MFGILLLIVIVGAVAGLAWFISETNKETLKAQQRKWEAETQAQAREQQRLYEEYHIALAGTDKAKALMAGRAYHGFIRKGILTLYDEQAIANDLATMQQL